MTVAACDQSGQMIGLRVGQLRHRPHPRNRGFARQHPVVEQHRMGHQKGRHAQTGGIADAQMPLGRAGQRAAPCVFHQIVGKVADQPDGQHFGSERPVQTGAGGENITVRDAKLAVPIYGGGPHQIAPCPAADLRGANRPHGPKGGRICLRGSAPDRAR